MFTTPYTDSTAIIQICNLALSHLGIMNTITSLSDSSREALACNQHIHSALDTAQSEHRWPWGKVQVALSVMPQTVLGWNFLYTYPSTALTVWTVFDEGTADEKEAQDFEVILLEGITLSIASNLEDAYCEYAKRITDPTLYSSNFAMCASYYLASQIAMPLTTNPDLADAMRKVAANFKMESQRISGSEQQKKPTPASNYVKARG